MKIRNEDIKQLTEIKQYFLDPPHSFKLFTYAIPKAEEAIRIVSNYPKLEPMLISLQEVLQRMQQMSADPSNLRRTMIEFGKSFGYLNR